MPAQRPGQSKQDFATPRSFISAVERRFGALDWDLAAHRENTRCGEFFYGPGSTHGEDSLAIDWATRHPSGNLWINPPYGDIGPWARKAAIESRRRHGMILMLTPASVGARWFVDHVHSQAFVLALSPRLSFDGKAPFPKDCQLAVFSCGLHGFDTWRWDEVQP